MLSDDLLYFLIYLLHDSAEKYNANGPLSKKTELSVSQIQVNFFI